MYFWRPPTVVFDLTLFNEVTKSDNILRKIEASVIDSCIEVIIGLPDKRTMRLIHRIPSYFDTPDPTFLEPRDQGGVATSDITCSTLGAAISSHSRCKQAQWQTHSQK